MHSAERGYIINNVNLDNIINTDVVAIVELIGPERYKLFQNSLKSVKENYLKNVTDFSVDKILIKSIKNDENSKYERFFEIAFNISGHNVDQKESQMDFVFEIFKVKNEPESCDLLSYYMSEFKKE